MILLIDPLYTPIALTILILRIFSCRLICFICKIFILEQTGWRNTFNLRRYFLIFIFTCNIYELPPSIFFLSCSIHVVSYHRGILLLQAPFLYLLSYLVQGFSCMYTHVLFDLIFKWKKNHSDALFGFMLIGSIGIL